MEELSQEELDALESLGDNLQHITNAVKKVAASSRIEEISEDEFDAVMRAPQSKPRKSKVLERTYHNWFYETQHSYGQCENDDCIDPRGGDTAMVAEVNGKKMCRFCFLAGWNEASE